MNYLKYFGMAFGRAGSFKAVLFLHFLFYFMDSPLSDTSFSFAVPCFTITSNASFFSITPLLLQCSLSIFLILESVLYGSAFYPAGPEMLSKPGHLTVELKSDQKHSLIPELLPDL